jgi:hypothetical protein
MNGLWFEIEPGKGDGDCAVSPEPPSVRWPPVIWPTADRDKEKKRPIRAQDAVIAAIRFQSLGDPFFRLCFSMSKSI